MGACLNGSAEIYIGIGLLPENHSPDLLASSAQVCCIAVVVVMWSDVLCMMGYLMLADATTPILLQCLSRFVLLEIVV
jgi:hypothetical protein